jgi:peptidoglycan/LPS O-acetylase OafA/YrhL
MSAEFSLYLDLVRLIAALLVLQAHTNLRVLTESIPRLSSFGHSAVIVFFVLSGYVIAYVVDTREHNPRDYAISRAARIYSVVIPALVVALLLDAVGSQIDPGTYVNQSPRDWWPVRVLATLTFMNEPWGISITAFSGPFWSVSYEVWYYILFGIFTFWRRPGRVTALSAAALIAGPKVLLLMPVWLLGVCLYRSGALTRLSWPPAALLFVASFAMIIGYHAVDGPMFLREVVAKLVGTSFQVQRMAWSGEFIGDYLLGLLVALNFLSFRACAPVVGRVLLPFTLPIRWAAGYTFSLYLFHRPLILLYTASIHGNLRSEAFYCEVVLLVLLSVVVLGSVTEHRKKWVRTAIERAFASARGTSVPTTSQAVV